MTILKNIATLSLAPHTSIRQSTGTQPVRSATSFFPQHCPCHRYRALLSSKPSNLFPYPTCTAPRSALSR